MSTNFQKVKKWMKIAGQPVREDPTPEIEEWQLRIDLIKEEFKEFKAGVRTCDLVEIADGIGDLLYVVYGAAVSFGIDADAVFDLLHENNMTKFITCPECSGDGIDDPGIASECRHCGGYGVVPYAVREDGKILKSPAWQPPDLKPLLGLA